MIDIIFVVVGSVSFFMAALQGIRAHGVAQLGSLQAERTKITVGELQRRMVDGGVRLQKLRLENEGLETLVKEATARVATLDAQITELAQAQQPRIYLPSGPYDPALPNWIVEIASKMEGQPTIDGVPFRRLPQRLLINAETETRAAAAVSKRYPDMRLKVRVLGLWEDEAPLPTASADA